MSDILAFEVYLDEKDAHERLLETQAPASQDIVVTDILPKPNRSDICVERIADSLLKSPQLDTDPLVYEFAEACLAPPDLWGKSRRCVPTTVDFASVTD